MAETLFDSVRPMNSGPSVREPMQWWNAGVVYQVYIRSFADSNGDGIGDINGLRSRLGYLSDLGVDAIWVNPWYQSPLNDGGYDVSDYRAIEPRFGTLADAEALITEAHAHGIKVVVDLVPNHTSSEHRWFQEALGSTKESVARSRYHFRPGKGADSEEPPTNWSSVFGGSAWTRLADGDWYLHLFDSTQPDLNWENQEVRTEMEQVMRFWLDRGADGFRIDVAHGLVKDMSYPDHAEEQEILISSQASDHPFWDRDGIHPIVRQWRQLLDEYDDRILVAEAWVAADSLPRYLRPDEYHQSFNFDFLSGSWDAAQMQQLIASSLDAVAAVEATPTWVLSNHDVVRHATRLGLPQDTDWRRWLLDGPHQILDTDLGLARARAAVMFMLALPGSVYLYQGEELGLHEVWDLPDEVLDDPVWERSGHTMKGRDGCRVPIPWAVEGPSLGFGSGPAWLPQPEWFGAASVEAQQAQPGSTLELYRAALALRSKHLVGDAEAEWLDAPEGVIGFRRGSGVECWLNVSGQTMTLPTDREILLTSTSVGHELPVNSAAWLK